jgi:hypothetical protein
MPCLAQYPGGELIHQGLADLAEKKITIPSCLIGIAWPKMSRFGLVSPDVLPPFHQPELELYRLLCQESGDAYSRYNSLIRLLVSFQNSMECTRRTTKIPKVSGLGSNNLKPQT